MKAKNRLALAWEALLGESSPKEAPEGSIQEAIKKGLPIGGVLPPHGRPSTKIESSGNYRYLTKNILGESGWIATPTFKIESIAKIRQLVSVNPDVSQALADTVALVNTGIQDIQFDSSVPPEDQVKMKLYIKAQSKLWGDGTAGIHGLINKMASQLFIGGAISGEWVPGKELRSVVNYVFVNPEKIAWVRERGRYAPYQRLTQLNSLAKGDRDGLHKLNPNTYKYYALNGDEDNPAGTPPYLAALESLDIQVDMMENIRFTMDMVGLLGYLDAKIAKPEQNDNESPAAYITRLNQLLAEFKTRVSSGFKDGINVGFEGDHEYNFNSTTKGVGNMDLVWQLNELQVASGLKFDSAFLGRSYNSSETSITILFTKMLSILANAQGILAENLEYGFSLSLLLAGYKFKSLKVVFNKSTITDTLKYQQAEEIKIRNNKVLYADGIISQYGYATSVGQPKPDRAEPRVPLESSGDIIGKQVKKETRKDQKSKSKKTTTDKKNPQGTIRRQNSLQYIPKFNEL